MIDPQVPLTLTCPDCGGLVELVNSAICPSKREAKLIVRCTEKCQRDVEYLVLVIIQTNRVPAARVSRKVLVSEEVEGAIPGQHPWEIETAARRRERVGACS